MLCRWRYGGRPSRARVSVYCLPFFLVLLYFMNFFVTAYRLSQYLIPYNTRSVGYMSLPPPHTPLASFIAQRQERDKDTVRTADIKWRSSISSSRRKNNKKKKSVGDYILQRASRLPITTLDVWEGVPGSPHAHPARPHPRIFLSTPGWLSPLSIHNIPFLLEFITHHLHVGVHHIYIGVAFAYTSPHFKLMLRVLKKYIQVIIQCMDK